MFNKIPYEFCIVYHNCSEGIEVQVPYYIDDYNTISIWINGEHMYECNTITKVEMWLRELGIDFKV